VGNVVEAGNYEIIGGRKGHIYFRWEPGEGVGDPLSASVEHPDGVAAVRVEGGADVPAI